MNGIQIEYFLGLYFLVTSLSLVNGKLTADIIRLVAGVVLLLLAVVFFSPIR